MLGILLMILKIIGIILLIVLAIVIAVLGILLFVPVRYRFYGCFRENCRVAEGKITWLMHIVSCPFFLTGENPGIQFRIFGKKVDLEKRKQYIDHIYALIDASSMLNVNMVTTFLGRVPDKNVEENLEIVKEVWPPILEYAKEKGVKIAIENCPMWFTADEWPGGQNLMTSPENWRKVFEVLPYDNLGINYDPSHFVWQQIDYIKPIYEFKDKIFHVHYKDIKIYQDKLNDVGIMAYPLKYMSPKLCGLGDVDWGKYVSALTDIGYQGYSVIEVEDKAFEGSLDNAKKAVKLSAKYLRNFVG